MTPIFNSVLQQQMQQEDKDGKKTVAFLYKQWYTEVLLRRVCNGSIIYSMSRRALVNFSPDPTFPFSPEEYSDITELRALVELIGPLGMKHIRDAVMCKVDTVLGELKVHSYKLCTVINSGCGSFRCNKIFIHLCRN